MSGKFHKNSIKKESKPCKVGCVLQGPKIVWIRSKQPLIYHMWMRSSLADGTAHEINTTLERLWGDTKHTKEQVTKWKFHAGSSNNNKQSSTQCYMLSFINPIQPLFEKVNCFKRLLNTITCVKNVSNADSSHMRHNLLPEKRYGVVKCASGEYVSTLYTCDGCNDCFDGTDEINCLCPLDGANFQTCRTNCSVKHKCFCAVLFAQHKTGGYHSNSAKHSNEPESPLGKVSNASRPYLCKNSTLKIPYSLINDAVPDCPNNDDEMEHLTGENNNTMQYECFPGGHKFYSQDERCLYNLSRDTSTLMYCRNGKHLQGCERVSCISTFKCTTSYCIPYRYRCDGQWDCWNGEEEMRCTNFSCQGLFKCKLASTCILTQNVCDDVTDCPQSDDEQFCSPISCSAQCLCSNLCISCFQISPATIQQLIFVLQFFVFVHISGSKLPPNINITSSVEKASVVEMLNNSLTMFCICEETNHEVLIKQLNLRDNKISELPSICFHCLSKLRELNLRNNEISQVHQFSFANCSDIFFLDLSHNFITDLDKFSLCGLDSLKILSVFGNGMHDIKKSSLTGLNAALILMTGNYHVCCLSSETFSMCTARPSWPASCTNLLPSAGLRVMVWVLACLIEILCIVCLGSIFVQWHTERKLNAYNKHLMHVNISDFVVGLCLFIIAISDIRHTDSFMEGDKLWRSSFLCHLSAFLFLLALLAGASFMMVISIARYRVVEDPFEKPFSKKHNIFFTSFITLTFSTFLIICIVTRKLIEDKSSLSLPPCLLLGDTDGSVAQLVITVTVPLYLLLILGIIEAFSLKLILHDKSDVVLDEKEEQKRQKAIAIHLILSGTTNIISWVPPSVFCLVSVFLNQFSLDALYWFSLIILPLNCLMNPLIYRLSDIKEKMATLKCPSPCRPNEV